MSVIRNRAKNNFPMVLLTLLSIVQALAFELLWEEVRNHHEFYQLSWVALGGWIRIVTTFLGIILIWHSYASNAMRFRWVPSTSDSFFPFVIGVVQFVMVGNLESDAVPQWLLMLAILFVAIPWVSQHDMRRAREEIENEEFFRARNKASLKDFFPLVAIVVILCFFSVLVWVLDGNLWLSGLASLIALIIIATQMAVMNHFWIWSMTLGEGVVNNTSDEKNVE
ncbi:MAG: hypothetical protein V7708_00625 [Oceanicoccus sp.]